MPQQEGTRKKKKKKRKEKKFTDKYILYIYLHFNTILQCNFNTEKYTLQVSTIIYYYFNYYVKMLKEEHILIVLTAF